MLIFELKSFNGCTYNYLTKYIKKKIMWFEFEKKDLCFETCRYINNIFMELI